MRGRASQHVLLAGVLLVVPLTGALVLVRAVTGDGPSPAAAAAAGLAALLLLGAGAAVPAVRLRSGELLRSAAAFAVLVVAGTAGLAATVLALGRLPEQPERPAVLAGVVGCALAAALALPLAAAARTWSAAVVRGTRRSPEDVLRTFGDRASRGVALDDLLRQLADSLRRALPAARVQVWTGDGGRLERSVSVPAATRVAAPLDEHDVAVLARVTVAGEQWLATWLPALREDLREDLRRDGVLRVVPAVHDGRVLGLLVVEGARRLDDADDAALLDLGRRLGAVLSSRVLDDALRHTLDDLRRANAELRASRARLVATADAERRRLERDLHDGAQQHLVALAVTLSLAGQALADDPDGAAELVEAAREQARLAVVELRDLAHGLYPPVLADAGLEQALRGAAARVPSPVTLELAGVGRHRADVEAAVYFCCLEALTNAAKHAPGAPVVVRGGVEAGRLRVEVLDEGPGMTSAPHRGQGVDNVVDRIGAVGGTARWTGAPGGGTAVVLDVPVAPDVPEQPRAGVSARS